ncbi:hypothetical protein BKN38_03935 [Helicobacter sp. CLO-3]|nr:hypothetical protein BA723_03915 [Helicobacter sp. CLO-3]OHU84070.1 hypothetical protein BKN38_03935 [Helicobacter sp. CLO-3]
MAESKFLRFYGYHKMDCFADKSARNDEHQMGTLRAKLDSSAPKRNQLQCRSKRTKNTLQYKNTLQ